MQSFIFISIVPMFQDLLPLSPTATRRDFVSPSPAPGFLSFLSAFALDFLKRGRLFPLKFLPVGSL